MTAPYCQNDTNTFYYNCGGYALGTYDWYEPYNVRTFDWDNIEDYEVPSLTAQMVERMLEEITGLRRIYSLDEANSNERIVLFRMCPTDFHYIVSFDHKNWWHKIGCGDIQPFTDNLFAPWDCGCHYYDGEVIIFALPL